MARIRAFFFHLEGLRAINQKELCKALNDSELVNLQQENWCRVVDYLYTDQPLNAAGSIKKGGRFNIGKDLMKDRFSTFPALYVADSYETAYAEKFGVSEKEGDFLGNEFALREFNSFSAVKVRINLSNVFDLSKAKNLKKFTEIISKFKISPDLLALRKKLKIKGKKLITETTELKADLLDPSWRHYPVQYEIPSNSQIFGRLLKEAGFEAILYPSAKNKSGECVAVFLENMESSESYIELVDKAPNQTKYTRLDSNNWKKLSK